MTAKPLQVYVEEVLALDPKVSVTKLHRQVKAAVKRDLPKAQVRRTDIDDILHRIRP